VYFLEQLSDYHVLMKDSYSTEFVGCVDYMHVCMCVCILVCMCVCMFVCMCVYVCMHV
jgi:hypothetical protein